MGPYKSIDYQDFHCFPLLIRPKDQNLRRLSGQHRQIRGRNLGTMAKEDLADYSHS